AAGDRQPGADADDGQHGHAVDPGACPCDRLLGPAGPGRARLRDGGSVQPVLDPPRGANGPRWQRDPPDDTAGRLPGRGQAAAAGDVPAGPRARGPDRRWDLDALARLVPGFPQQLRRKWTLERVSIK